MITKSKINFTILLIVGHWSLGWSMSLKEHSPDSLEEQLLTYFVSKRIAKEKIDENKLTIQLNTEIEERFSAAAIFLSSANQEIEEFELLRVYSLNKIFGYKRLLRNAIIQAIQELVRNKEYACDIHRQLRMLPPLLYSQETKKLAQEVEQCEESESISPAIFKDSLKLVRYVEKLTKRREYRDALLCLLNENPSLIEALLYRLKDDPVSQYLVEDYLLERAVAQSQIEALDFFFKRGVSPNARCSGLTLESNCVTLLGLSLSLSLEHSDKKIMEFLLKNGASVTKTVSTYQDSAHKLNAFTYLIGSHGERSIQKRLPLLLKYGLSSVNDKDGSGRTPLGLAKERLFEGIITLLQAHGAVG
jgi:hypothetical protein